MKCTKGNNTNNHYKKHYEKQYKEHYKGHTAPTPTANDENPHKRIFCWGNIIRMGAAIAAATAQAAYVLCSDTPLWAYTPQQYVYI